jgi:transposase
MRQKPQTRQTAADKTIKDIRRATRKQCSAEEKIRIVLDGLHGEESIAELCTTMKTSDVIDTLDLAL